MMRAREVLHTFTYICLIFVFKATRAHLLGPFKSDILWGVIYINYDMIIYHLRADKQKCAQAKSKSCIPWMLTCRHIYLFSLLLLAKTAREIACGFVQSSRVHKTHRRSYITHKTLCLYNILLSILYLYIDRRPSFMYQAAVNERGWNQAVVTFSAMVRCLYIFLVYFIIIYM